MPDEFASVTRNDALVEVIAAEIAARGPIAFERFMALALYHPTLGYYRSGKERIGERGDYVTSPYVSPLFGAIVGRQLAQLWGRLGSPDAFDLVEMGAGDGRLMRDVIAWCTRADRSLASALRPVFVEPDPTLRDAQRRTLAHLDAAPRWVAALGDLGAAGIEGCLLSNELVDALPVRVFRVREGRPAEVRVDLYEGALVAVEASPTTVERPHYLQRLFAALPDDSWVEVGEAAQRWMVEAGACLRRGFVLTFDYGYPAVQLYAPWRTQGTLMAFYRHAVSPDPLAHPGEQDLTAHVDFTALALAGRGCGMEAAGFTSQREFLTALGVHEAVSATGLPLEETLARRRAVLALTDPAGLGRVRVLLQAKDADGSGLRGFTGAPPAWETLLAGIDGE